MKGGPIAGPGFVVLAFAGIMGAVLYALYRMTS
jgi:hypothetical protein